MKTDTDQYASIAKRTFESALVHLLETEYGVLGGRRILQLLAEDVQKLVEQFYPTTERLKSGDIVWTCTADEGRKAVPGKRTEDYKAVTVILPLVTKEDLDQWTSAPLSHKQVQARAHKRDQQRMVRLIKAAAAQGGCLTKAELSVMLNRCYSVLTDLSHEYEAETGERLPLKGEQMDQGSRPTHKADIVRLFEQGLQPPDIVHETHHTLTSVERYIKDYERVKLLLAQGMPVSQISVIIGRGLHVVLEYVKIAQQYHPELVPGAVKV